MRESEIREEYIDKGTHFLTRNSTCAACGKRKEVRKKSDGQPGDCYHKCSPRHDAARTTREVARYQPTIGERLALGALMAGMGEDDNAGDAGHTGRTGTRRTY